MDQRFPNWLRLIVGISALMQIGFGLTLMVGPSQIGHVWPWVMPPLTTRILGASTLVSVPLALLSIGFNRYSFAAIPFVMMATYRVLQLAAGVMHIERFGANPVMSVNYFGGGALMLAVLSYGLWMGYRGRLTPAPHANAAAMPWDIPSLARAALAILGIAFIILGIVFFVAAGNAPALWFDAKGITPLTARLFSSPLTGLGLGLILVSRATDWRSIAIPAIGMFTIGCVVLLAFALGRADFAPQTMLAWLVACTPVALLTAGAAILMSKPAAQTLQATRN